MNGIYRYRGLWAVAAVLAGSAGCGSTPAPSAERANQTESRDARWSGDPGKVDPDLVGCWRGYWSPRGDADTERYLFLSDGSWAWLAPREAIESGRTSVARRSGRWGVREGVITLVEHQREELAGCNPSGDSQVPCQPGAGCPCAGTGSREVQHGSPIVKQLSLGDCPPNSEAERLDAAYTCRSFDGQAFWRHAEAGQDERAPLFSK